MPDSRELKQRIAELGRQLAEASRALGMAESYRLNYEHATKIDRADYESRMAEAKQDAARLDWLETQNKNASLHLYLGGPWRHFSAENPAQGFWKFDERMDLGKHETAREAIDAARKGQG